MLFNITDDPYEQHDVSKKHPEICAQGAKIILDWHDGQMLRSDSTVDPMWVVLQEGGPHHTIGQLDKYIQRLNETGRKKGAQQLKEKYL